jgi:hypothetical protein
VLGQCVVRPNVCHWTDWGELQYERVNEALRRGKADSLRGGGGLGALDDSTGQAEKQG